MDIANISNPNGSNHNSPTRLIIHSMGEFINDNGNAYHAHEWLSHIGLSAHYLICPSGVVIKCRDTDTGAYHAKGNNSHTVGIEILVKGVHTYDTFKEAIKTEYVTSEQFNALLEISKAVIDHWNISIDDVVRHSDIDPERKVDPGEGFDFEMFRRLLI